MMTKSKARSPGGLLRHLARVDTNETVEVGTCRGVTPTLSEAMEELALRSATVAAKKSWYHVVGNPEPGQPMSEQAWEAYWADYEAEFDLKKQFLIEVRHLKHRRNHRHRVYSLVRDDGTLVSVSHNYRKNELVSRLVEIAGGHPLHPGKHHRWVVAELARRGVKLPMVPRTAERSTPTFNQSEHQQAERKLGTDPRDFKAQVYAHYAQSGGDWRRFAASLDRDRITVGQGTSALLVIDERSRFHLPLARLLREEAKRAGQPIRIRSADLANVFGRVKPLKQEQIEIDRRQRVLETASPPSGSARDETARSAATHFADRMQTAVAHVLLQERRRAERLKRARDRKAALRRGDLDARVAAIADDLAVTVAAGVIRHLRSRYGLRTVVLVIAALAAGSGIAPVVLAAAAVALLRRGEIKGERASLRGDVDAVKAARTGWTFAEVTPPDRARYAALVRSDIVDPAGPDAGPIIAAIGQHQAAAFLAWWSHASPKQRGIVEGWQRRGHSQKRTRIKAAGGAPKARER